MVAALFFAGKGSRVHKELWEAAIAVARIPTTNEEAEIKECFVDVGQRFTACPMPCAVDLRASRCVTIANPRARSSVAVVAFLPWVGGRIGCVNQNSKRASLRLNSAAP